MSDRGVLAALSLVLLPTLYGVLASVDIRDQVSEFEYTKLKMFDLTASRKCFRDRRLDFITNCQLTRGNPTRYRLKQYVKPT